MPKQYYNAPPRQHFDPITAPKDEIKKEFARRLQHAMADKGMSQSDLARALSTGRYNISEYVRAKTFPSPAMRLKLAKALGVDADWLLPLVIEGPVDNKSSGFEIMGRDRESMVWLRINQHVPMATAVKILDLLEKAS